MLTNFFSKSKPITVLVILALFLCYYGIAFFSGSEKLFDYRIIPLFLLTIAVVSFIDNKNNLSFDNAYTLLFFVVFLGVFPDILIIGKEFYANLILLLFLRKVFSLQSPKLIIKKIFDAGFWLGITFLLNPFSLLFFIMLYVGIVIFNRLSIRNLIIPIIGFIIPVFLFFTYSFWFDKTDVFYDLFYFLSSYDLSFYNLNHVVGFLCIGLLTLISIIRKTPKTLMVINKFRSSWILMLINLVLAIFLVILNDNKNGSELLYLAFPTAIILANGIELYEQKWFVDIITILCLVFPIIMIFIK